MNRRRTLILLLAAVTAVWCARPALALQEPGLTEDQMRVFLLTAKVVKAKSSKKGVTGVSRLTLSDGSITHDAAFQPVDESKTSMTFASGQTELNFRDSYHYDIAAWELSKLLALNHMMPVTVERNWSGKTGALSWWIPWKWDGEIKRKQNLSPPDLNAWNRQMQRMWVFSQLVYDTDRNLTNMLITEDWKLWMIDFTRAFRLRPDLQDPKALSSCDRELLAKLKMLNQSEVEAAAKKHLTKSEVKAVMARRDRIVKHFEALIAQKGETAVLY